MPVPSNQITHCEILMNGVVAAGGSTNRLAQFSFHFRRTATVLTIPKGPIDTAFQAAIATPIAAALNARYLQSNNSVRFVNDADDIPVPVNHALPGLIAGDSMATIDAAFILLRVGLRGRGKRGSKHLFPMSESDTTGGTDDIFNVAALGRLSTIAAAILAGFTDATGNVWVPSVLSRKNSQLAKNPTSVVAYDVTSVAVAKRVGVMRHRRVHSVY